MSVTTLSPSSTFVTPKYRRTLPVTSVPNPANPSTSYDVIVPSSSRTAATHAYLIGSPKSALPAAISSQTYLSNNTSPSGISFLSFWNAASLTNVSLDVGPNASGDLDYGDTILIDSSKSKGVAISNSSFVAGNTANSPVSNDKDLVVFGSTSSKDGQSWNGIAGLSVDLDDEVDLLGSTVRTGNDRDTIVFASQNVNSVIQNSTINAGAGDDYVFFNRTQSVRNGNTVDLGGGADTIVFATNNFTGITAASPLAIQGFVNGQDVFRVGGVNYTTQAAVIQQFGNRITFS